MWKYSKNEEKRDRTRKGKIQTKRPKLVQESERLSDGINRNSALKG